MKVPAHNAHSLVSAVLLPLCARDGKTEWMHKSVCIQPVTCVLCELRMACEGGCSYVREDPLFSYCFCAWFILYIGREKSPGQPAGGKILPQNVCSSPPASMTKQNACCRGQQFFSLEMPSEIFQHENLPWNILMYWEASEGEKDIKNEKSWISFFHLQICSFSYYLGIL